MSEKTIEAGPAFPFQMSGRDGNSFAILGRFHKEARKAGWTKEQREALCAEAMSGDYDHLLATFMKYTDAQ